MKKRGCGKLKVTITYKFTGWGTGSPTVISGYPTYEVDDLEMSYAE